MAAVRAISGLTDLGNAFDWDVTPRPLGFNYLGWTECYVSQYGSITFGAINNEVTPSTLDWDDPGQIDYRTGLFPYWVNTLNADDPAGLATVYAGPCTVDGRTAFAVTWEGNVPQLQVTGGTPTREATYQAILYRDGAIEFNYDQAGYSVGDVTDYTSSSFPNAQYPGVLMGWHRVTSVDYYTWSSFPAPQTFVEWPGSLYSETLVIADRKDTQTQDSPLLDGNSNALISNSYNSTVAGRYYWGPPTSTTLRQRQSPRRSPSRVSWRWV